LLWANLFMIRSWLQSNGDRSDLIPRADPIEESLVGSGFDLFGFLGSLFGRNEFMTGAGIMGLLGLIWSIYAVLAYIFAIFLLVLYVYASINRNLYSGLKTQVLRDMEKLYDEQFRGVARSSRLNDVMRRADSDNPNDWKLAIIEADIILDDILKKRGYTGSSLGERLKSISPNQLESLNDAWEAHKIRNRIAHDGADFVLTKRVAQETIARYLRIFREFGIQ
jgi:hypothetical protein